MQRYSQTSGRVLGALGVIAAVVTAGMVLVRSEDPSYATVALCVFFGALAWATLLRPRLALGRSELVLRNMLSTVTVPLAAIESVTVRQVLVVFAGDRRFTSAAVGRTRRQLVKESFGSGQGHGGMMGFLPAFPSSPEKPDNPKSSYGLFVEERVRARVADALAREGVRARSAEQARFAERIERRPAIVEIAVLTASLVAAVVLLVS